MMSRQSPAHPTRTPSPLSTSSPTPRWNPNYVCEVTNMQHSSPNVPLARELRNLQLVSKLLSLDKPVVTEKMLAFLRQDTVHFVLCNFLTRATPFKDESYNGGPADTTPRAGTDPTIEDRDEHNAIKWGFRAMNLLTNSNAMSSFVSENLYTIIPEMFRIFEPQARGNFHHLLAVIKKFIPEYNEDLLSIACDNHLICATLAHLHNPPVAELVVLLLTSGMGMPLVRQRLFEQLVGCNFLPQIVSMILTCEDVNRASDYLYFLQQLIDALQSEMHADILFASLCDEQLLDMIAMGCGTMGNYEPYQRRLCVDLLHSLLKKSEKAVLEPLTVGGKPIVLTNMFAVVQKAAVDAVSHHALGITHAAISRDDYNEEDEEEYEEEDEDDLPASPRPILNRNMSEMLIDTGVKLSTYTVPRVFTSERLLLLEIVVHAASVSPDTILDHCTRVFWRRLVDWFFEYPHNNLYHNTFFQLFRTAVIYDHWPSLVTLLGKRCSLIKRMFKIQTCPDIHGHIVLICNVLRLKADMLSPSAFIPRRLKANKEWNIMIDDIIADTQIQTNQPFEAQQKLTPDYAPAMVHLLGSNGRPARQPKPQLDDDEGSVDLGGHYANQLGFVGASLYQHESEADTADKLAADVEEELDGLVGE